MRENCPMKNFPTLDVYVERENKLEILPFHKHHICICRSNKNKKQFLEFSLHILSTLPQIQYLSFSFSQEA
jgi:hypothetical protein